MTQQQAPKSSKRHQWLRRSLRPSTIRQAEAEVLTLLSQETGLSRSGLQARSSLRLEHLTVALETLTERGLIASELIDEPEHGNKARRYWVVVK
ncbi:hypothetical protein [Deinococcus ruber]|uniref:Uncharacterized protein n=1 Tax=Deinococcus ruber TaxID=1848197 RepID=A0A918FES3_9DEIO|nr:hypothetical protein [Deinococcus ruber]GGR31324.1 hypothetical protein GCM10008957_47510 [Deinococcus ruber]